MNRRKGLVLGTAILFFADSISAPALYAAFGQAERLDEVQESDLQEYHQNLLSEELMMQSAASDSEQMALLQQKEQTLQQLEGREKDEVEDQIEDLKQQLLKLPKRDRFGVQLNGKYLFDSNINRAINEQEDNDSVFDVDGAALFDLGGKKTDLRFEVKSGKQWNWEFPEKDFWTAEERIRFRRKYFKKIAHASHSKLARHSSKTVEINSEKVRWDSQQSQSFNYVMTRKLSMNAEFGMRQRYFPNEVFDQDSSWDAMAAPSAFWMMTPKSRLALGYQIGTTKIRTKVGNANAHSVHAGYFGRVTRKSSLSLDLAFSHQEPKSRETPVSNGVTSGIGYILQMTGKTQGILQLIHALQNTSSDIIGLNTDGVEQTTKTDAHFANTSLSLSFNSRLTRKMTGIATFNASLFRSKVAKTGDEETESTQLSFPMSLSINYVLSRWIRVSAGYTFAYRMGPEKLDRYKAHSFTTAMNINF